MNAGRSTSLWTMLFMSLSLLFWSCLLGGSIYAGASTVETNNGSGQMDECVVTVAKKHLRFVERPELGYVLKTRKEAGKATTFDALPVQSQPPERDLSGVVGHPQLNVVRGQEPLAEYGKAIEILGVQPRVEYVAPLFSSGGEVVAIIPEIVVRLRNEMAYDKLGSLCAEANCRIVRKLELAEPLYYLLAPKAQNADDVFASVQILNEAGFVEWAVPNVASQPRLCGQVIPSDEYFPDQWHLHNTGQSGGTPNVDINAPEAWEITMGDPNIVVAVLDSGVDLNHPDLIGNLVHGYDFCDDDDAPNPTLGESAGNAHGTGCAGLIAEEANNGIGVAGVAPRCKIMPIRVLRVNKQDSEEWVTDAILAEAIVWAARNGADILSISWGALSDSVVSITHEATISVTSPNGIGRSGKGCVVLAAAGNTSDDIVLYPAAFPEVIAVGATDDNDQRWDYSSYGSPLELVAPSGSQDQSARIVKLWTTDITGADGFNVAADPPGILDYTDNFGGTSAACPIAAGVAALVLSVNPNLTNAEVRTILVRSAVVLGPSRWDEEYGFGRVDAYAAVKMVLDPQWVSTFFVDDDAANDPGPGDPNVSDPLEDGSPEHPFDAVQEAIDYAVPGNTIVVRAGTYTGNGKNGISFRARAITVRSEDGPENCVIDCRHSGRGFLFDLGERPDSVLEGLTITNGYSDYTGGGIRCWSGSNPTIVNCVLRDNLADKYGGGMECFLSSPTLINCTFIGNSAESGGGMYNHFESSPILIDCTFIENSAESGGGMYNDHESNPSLIGCTFIANVAQYGGGMYNRHRSNPVLNNCTFVRNLSQNGCALACDSREQKYPGRVRLTNSILWDGGSEIWNNDGSTIEISYNNIWGGQAGLYDPRQRITWGRGNLDIDPLFADYENGDYHLKSQAGRWDPSSESWVKDDVTSPCIDAGDPNSPLGEEPEPNGGRINMGAYGGTTKASKSP